MINRSFNFIIARRRFFFILNCFLGAEKFLVCPGPLFKSSTPFFHVIIRRTLDRVAETSEQPWLLIYDDTSLGHILRCSFHRTPEAGELTCLLIKQLVCSNQPLLRYRKTGFVL